MSRRTSDEFFEDFIESRMKTGHQKVDENRNKSRNEIVSQVNDYLEETREKWLIDSGSTVHVTYDDTYMFNKKQIN